MKILLVSVNRERIPYPVAPLGLLYLAEALRKENYTVTILDLCFSDNIPGDIQKAIDLFSPDAIGVSIRNIDNLSYPGVISYLPDIKDVVCNIKRCSAAPIILGGSAFSLYPEDILRHTECDMGIVGDGEHAFVQLIRKIKDGQSGFDMIDNVIYISGEKVHKNKTSRTSGNFVVKRDLINNALYSKFGGMGNVQTKRGCRFDCSYCTYPVLEGTEYRLHSPDTVADEIEQGYTAHNIEHFFIVDSVFNYPEKHAEEVCRSIQRKKLPVTWSCFANPVRMTRGLLELMKGSGCTNIEFGTDALSREVLSRLRKSFSIEDVFRTSKICSEVGIKCAHYIMFGGPGETIETLNEAFRNIGLLEYDAIIAMVGIRIYPGTGLHKMAIEEGIISKDKNLLSPCFYLSPKIPLELLLKEVTDFAAKHPKCIIPGLGIKSSEKMFEILRKYYQKGPLWGYVGQ